MIRAAMARVDLVLSLLWAQSLSSVALNVTNGKKSVPAASLVIEYPPGLHRWMHRSFTAEGAAANFSTDLPSTHGPDLSLKMV